MEGSLGVGVLGGYCCCIFLFLFLFFTTCSASLLPIGIHPLDDKYYASEVIKCKDGSKSLTRDRINDDFCDCLDGTDEPEDYSLLRIETRLLQKYHTFSVFPTVNSAQAKGAGCNSLSSAIFETHILEFSTLQTHLHVRLLFTDPI
ncbi:hypothetical protein CsSME_00019798 [Camellia sinensis var. sinensis]